MLDEATAQLDRAMKARNISECRRLEELLNELRHSAWLRHPNAWPSLFAHVRGRSSEMSDIREAQRLFERGDRQLREDNLAGLEQTVEALWRLLPPDVEKRRRSYGSGLRT
jgi:molecular chaperone DnaK